MSDIKIMDNDLIKRNLAIAYATSGLIRRIDGEDWIKTSEVKQSLNDVPTVDISGNEYFPYRTAYFNGVADGRATARPKGEWIPVGERLPEERINPNTYDFEEVLCTTVWGDVRAYKYGKPRRHDKPHFWYGGGIMDKYVIAWQQLPEPYKKGGAA